MALRSQLNLAALGASAGSGNWGYTSPERETFRARRHLGRPLGRRRHEPRERPAHRDDRGRLERVARGADVSGVRLRHDRGPDRPRHRGLARPGPAGEAADLERDVRLRALAVDRRETRACSTPTAPRAGCTCWICAPIPRTRARWAASPTSTSTTATRAATGSTPRRSATASWRRSTSLGTRRDPRDLTLQHRRELHPQRLAHARRPLPVHDRRARGLAARGLGPHGEARRRGSRPTSARPARSRTT